MSKYEKRSLIHLVEYEIYEWEMMNFHPLRAEEHYRLSGSRRMNAVRKRALHKQNMIWRWFYYGSPSFKEHENDQIKENKTD